MKASEVDCKYWMVSLRVPWGVEAEGLLPHSKEAEEDREAPQSFPVVFLVAAESSMVADLTRTLSME